MAIDLGYDESGSDDILLVTMQLSITEQARKLRRKWNKQLRQYGVDYFHAKEFRTLDHGVFGGLSFEKRQDLLTDLSKLNSRHIEIGMTSKVTKSYYDQKTNQEFRSRWGTAYTFSIHMLFAGAYFFAKHLNLRPEFNVLVEDGHRNSAQAIQNLNILKQQGFNSEMPDCKLLTVGLGSKVDHPILQAADMLAYSEWQKVNNRDLTIYHAMHSRSLRFEPEFLDFDADFVDVVVKGANEYMAQRKAWGQQKYGTTSAGV